MREYRFSLTRVLPYKGRFCPYTGEYGSVKTSTLVYFMQCYSMLVTPWSIIFPWEHLTKSNCTYSSLSNDRPCWNKRPPWNLLSKLTSAHPRISVEPGNFGKVSLQHGTSVHNKLSSKKYF